MSRHLILLVEDNPDEVDLTLRALQKSDISNEVVVARDGEEALHYLSDCGASSGTPHRQLPAVVLLDLKLPKVSGLEVLREMRASDRLGMIPVVILTSSDEPQDVLEAYRLHANSYIPKPLDFSRFVDALQQMLEYWLQLNVSPVQVKKANVLSKSLGT